LSAELVLDEAFSREVEQRNPVHVQRTQRDRNLGLNPLNERERIRRAVTVHDAVLTV